MKKVLFLFCFILLTVNAGAGEFVTYKVDNDLYEGYFTKVSKNAPLIILIHDWDGLTDYEIKRSEMLAKLGYSVFAVDLFGKGVRPTEIKDKREHTGELYKDRMKMRKLIQAGVNKAKSLGAKSEKMVAMGYCFGGAAVLEYARSGANFKGFVTFHGGLTTPEGQDYTKTKGTILVFHGTADSAISMSDFSKLAVELEENNVDHEMITYSGAPHAFTVFNSKNYQEKADKKSWERFLEYLETIK